MNREATMLYFITFFIMHYSVFVLVEPGIDAEAGVAAALEQFDEALEVEPYRVHLDYEEVRRMADHFKIDPADLHALAGKMPVWTRHDGGVDRDGLYHMTTCNPDGRWDWYEIGGRWDGFIPRARSNLITARTLANSPALERCLPAFVLRPDGQWLEHERCYIEGDWKNFKKVAMKQEDWLQKVRETLQEWPRHRVVCVDVHS